MVGTKETIRGIRGGIGCNVCSNRDGEGIKVVVGVDLEAIM